MKVKRVNTIKGFENISDRFYVMVTGKVLSMYRDVDKELQTTKDKKGNHIVFLTPKGGKTTNVRVSNLVYRAFVGEIPDRMTTVNIDGNLDNNHVKNIRLELKKSSTFRPVNCYNKRTGKFVKTYYSAKEVTEAGLDRTTVRRCAEKKSGHISHKGFTFEFLDDNGIEGLINGDNITV